MDSLLVTRQVTKPDHAATGAKMRTLRQHAGLTCRTLASRLGCTISYVSALERGSQGSTWTEERCQQYVAAIRQA